MTWSRFDDGYDEHEKVQDAWHSEPAAIGLHVMATTACNRWLSDGVIRPRWLQAQLPEKRLREKTLRVLVDVELFDVIPAGDTITVQDSDDNEIVLGPFEEPRYLVHDFLDRHDSSVQVKARRAADAERKRRGRRKDSARSPEDVRADADRTPPGIPADSARNPLASRARGRVGARPHPDPTRPDPQGEGAVPPKGSPFRATGMSNADARPHTAASGVV